MVSPAAVETDLHGNVPDHAQAVLLLVDVINDLQFPRNEYLVQDAPRLAETIRDFKVRCRAKGIPSIYVNDNKGRWRSDIAEVVAQAKRDSAPGREMVDLLAPEPEDYFILKPKHSVFFATPLEVILQHLGAHTVMMVGVTTNACVLISAGEVFVRGYRLVVPCDCVAALTPQAQRDALKLMEQNYQADTRPSTDLDLDSLLIAPQK
jgi:nicotinamidase-related amidase